VEREDGMNSKRKREDGGEDEAFHEAASLDTLQPAMDYEVILHLSISCMHVFHVSSKKYTLTLHSLSLLIANSLTRR
jgi:hypothetical protein